MDFRLLGAVEAWTPERQVDLGPRKQRLVFAVLALRVNQLVPVRRLVDLTWPVSPPETAQHAIHSRVSRLRAALAEAGAGREDVAIVTHGSSYVLRADPMTVDAHYFRCRVARSVAETDDATKVSMLRSALELWHGPPLADVATPLVTEQLCRGLEEIQLTALEECLDGELRLGRHGAVIGELMELVAQHPDRQRLLGQLMLALYRVGRGPDALAAYRSASRRLADEVGLDPEPRLQQLATAILCADPALDLSGPPQPRSRRVLVPDGAGRIDAAAEPARASDPTEPRQPERLDAGPSPPRDGGPLRAPARRTRTIAGSLGRTARAFRRSRTASARHRQAETGREGVPAASQVTLEAHRLTKNYGRRTAVADMSFAARQGEVLGLLGANGAGKTTTIRLLTTMLRPSAGDFAIAGIPSARQTEIRCRVGVLPEGTGYPGHQTGLHYLAYHARLFGMTRADAGRTAARLLDEVGLGDRACARISTYSRGMRQRLGIARALLNAPAVVLLDEPTLGLDPGGRHQVLGLLQEVASDSGATVLLSTSALAEIGEICTTLVVLEEGRVALCGPAAEVAPALADRRTGRVRVPSDQVGPAVRAVGGIPRVTVELAEDSPDVLQVSLPGTPSTRTGDFPLNDVLRALLGAGIPVLSCEADDSRRTDAVLARTVRPHRRP
jgi:ABC-2 type transport system ATP-binding protein